MPAADYTPLRYTRFTGDGAVAGSKEFAGVIVESGAAAGTLIIRDGTLVSDPIMATFKVDVANTTRVFPMPGMVRMQLGIFADLDTNIASAIVLHG